MSGLQLPGAFVLPSTPRSAKIFAEKSVVKSGKGACNLLEVGRYVA